MSDFGPIINSSVNRLNETAQKLHDTIEKQIEATNRQSRIMFWLTCTALFLAVVQAVAAFVQVCFTVR
jgi:hypothetical protein